MTTFKAIACFVLATAAVSTLVAETVAREMSQVYPSEFSTATRLSSLFPSTRPAL